MAAWLAGFGRFWYRFIVGDDWLLAAAVALVADYAFLRGGYGLWWLLPIVVVAALALSIWRAGGTPP
ncbi:MAG: hypothetical protein DLM67_05345 [Candidatus Nephthysia bennettiae]|uniref:Uncharacterized protein n=1 Tax=Candidatus Nephthysia bennettiae TaxID=3127016 RepID=A0A934K0N2_9BACT|nr:hypothetical protein [Candidatus Dormibacteraeota bacterium]MBJ7614838.1 hypothetical protein [Candidatus Dormibacteraeota bacterium]PZR98665.1 MAG: hypothetical protein DLM67_05345 [Candidatus Dormibacteraeota bacterium]